MVSCSHSPSNASVSSAFAFLHHDTCYPRCVLVFAPTTPPVATVELSPQNDELSNNTTLPSFSTSVLVADLSAQPPPIRLAWVTLPTPQHFLHRQAARELTFALSSNTCLVQAALVTRLKTTQSRIAVIALYTCNNLFCCVEVWSWLRNRSHAMQW